MDTYQSILIIGIVLLSVILLCNLSCLIYSCIKKKRKYTLVANEEPSTSQIVNSTLSKDYVENESQSKENYLEIPNKE